jgi:hypothetical protein
MYTLNQGRSAVANANDGNSHFLIIAHRFCSFYLRVLAGPIISEKRADER